MQNPIKLPSSSNLNNNNIQAPRFASTRDLNSAVTSFLNKFLTARPSIDDLVSKRILPNSGMQRIPLEPTRVAILVAGIDRKGSNSEGIFRLSPAAQAQRIFWESFVNDRYEIDKTDEFVLAASLKLYVRDQDSTLINSEDWKQFVQISQKATVEEKITGFSQVIEGMPENSRKILLYLFDLLKKISDNIEVTKMSPENLAIVWGPNLFKIDTSNPTNVITDTQNSKEVVSQLILHFASVREKVSSYPSLKSSMDVLSTKVPDPATFKSGRGTISKKGNRNSLFFGKGRGTIDSDTFSTSTDTLRASNSNLASTLKIPLTLKRGSRLLLALERRALNEPEIFRASPVVGEQREFWESFISGNYDVDSVDVHILAATLKQYLREARDLETPLVPEETWQKMVSCLDSLGVVTNLCNAIETLPELQRTLFLGLFHLLRLVVDNSAVNKVLPENLAVCFLPTFTLHKVDEEGGKKTQELIKFLINHLNTLRDHSIWPIYESSIHLIKQEGATKSDESEGISILDDVKLKSTSSPKISNPRRPSPPPSSPRERSTIRGDLTLRRENPDSPPKNSAVSISSVPLEDQKSEDKEEKSEEKKEEVIKEEVKETPVPLPPVENEEQKKEPEPEEQKPPVESTPVPPVPEEKKEEVPVEVAKTVEALPVPTETAPLESTTPRASIEPKEDPTDTTVPPTVPALSLDKVPDSPKTPAQKVASTERTSPAAWESPETKRRKARGLVSTSRKEEGKAPVIIDVASLREKIGNNLKTGAGPELTKSPSQNAPVVPSAPSVPSAQDLLTDREKRAVIHSNEYPENPLGLRVNALRLRLENSIQLHLRKKKKISKGELVRAVLVAQELVIKPKKNTANFSYVVFTDRQFFLMEPDPLAVNLHLAYKEIKDIVMDSSMAGLVLLNGLHSKPQYFSMGGPKTMNRLITQFEKARNELRINKPNANLFTITRGPLMGSEASENNPFSDKLRLGPVLESLSEAGFSETDIWNGQPDLYEIVKQNNLTKTMSSEAENLVEFVLPDTTEFKGSHTKSFNVDKNMKSGEVIKVLCSKMGTTSDPSKFVLATLGGRTIKMDEPLSSYGLGSIFTSWQLKLEVAGQPGTGMFNVEIHLPPEEWAGLQKKIIRVDAYMPVHMLIGIVCRKVNVRRLPHYYELRFEGQTLGDQSYLAALGLGIKLRTITVHIHSKTFPTGTDPEKDTAMVSGMIRGEFFDNLWERIQQKRKADIHNYCEGFMTAILDKAFYQIEKANEVSGRVASLSDKLRDRFFKFLRDKEREDYLQFKDFIVTKRTADLDIKEDPMWEIEEEEPEPVIPSAEVLPPPPPPPPVPGKKSGAPAAPVAPVAPRPAPGPSVTQLLQAELKQGRTLRKVEKPVASKTKSFAQEDEMKKMLLRFKNKNTIVERRMTESKVENLN
eukprot:TRINITY_DN3108_c0_g1_i1.p1 TRINITY_DN3108_c0_g1~~TRINITY_DN3108_c0_g1_i1.p1  ORF type:complete len:1431 (-),score=569.08 TRINITY_DN3108_c0_g1_i1:204-4448(-)